MPRIGSFEMTGWTGALNMPTAKGSRPSLIRTSALVADAISAVLLSTQYASVVSAGGSLEVEAPGGTPIAGVRCARVTITKCGKARIRPVGSDTRTYQLDATWELYV